MRSSDRLEWNLKLADPPRLLDARLQYHHAGRWKGADLEKRPSWGEDLFYPAVVSCSTTGHMSQARRSVPGDHRLHNVLGLEKVEWLVNSLHVVSQTVLNVR